MDPRGIRSGRFASHMDGIYSAATPHIVITIISFNPPVLPYSVTGYRDFIIPEQAPECKGKNGKKDSFPLNPG